MVGLELHWGERQLMRVRCSGDVHTLTGEAIAATDTMSYLGTTISSDGRVGSELNRRLGMAFAEFYRLKKVWGHTSIGERRKIELFNAIITPKLLYSLSTACLNAAERRRLDGAHCRMLRAPWGQAPNVLARVEREHPGPDATGAFDKYPSQATASSVWKGGESTAWGSSARIHFRSGHTDAHHGPLHPEGRAAQAGMG